MSKLKIESKICIVVRAEGPGPPTEIRVRRFLKIALRTCRLRCVQIRQEPADTPARQPRKAA